MAKGDKFYFDNFTESVALAKKAADYLVECLENYNSDNIKEMVEKMHSIKLEADSKQHEMVEALAKAFVTPVDREDLDMLSHQLDRVTVAIGKILQKFYMYDIKQINPSAIEFGKNIVEGCEILCKIIDEFSNFKKSKSMRSLIKDCKEVERKCDRLYLETTRDVTKNSTDVLTTVAWYKIFDTFEACADSCEHVSECVASIIMKNT